MPEAWKRRTKGSQPRESHVGYKWLPVLAGAGITTCKPRHGGRELSACPLSLSHALEDSLAISTYAAASQEYILFISQGLTVKSMPLTSEET